VNYRQRSPVRRITVCSIRAAAISGSATAADRMRAIPRRRSGSTRSSAQSCASIRAALPRPEGRRDSGTTRFRPSTNSPRTAIRRHSARSTPTDSGTPTDCRGTSTTGRCSRRTSG
jgi:hypothetical protein